MPPLKNRIPSGQWPSSFADQIARPFWYGAGACPGLGQWLLNKRLQSWKKKKTKVPCALAKRVLKESLITHVSPQQLTQRLAAVSYNNHGSAHDFRHQFVFNGPCGHFLSPVSQSQLDSEINQLFAEHMIWQNTPAYTRLCHKLRSHGAFRHNNVVINTLKDVDNYFARYVQLTESIDQWGYQTRRELHRAQKQRMKRQWLLEAGEQEVGVAIGPGGQIWRYGGGYHRTAIARNLGLATMPVMIRLVHDEWLDRQHYQLDKLIPTPL